MVGSMIRLPQEIIQNIAANSSAQHVLSLGRTCRHLRNACNDVFVMQACFFHSVGDPTSRALPTKEAVRKLLTANIPSDDPEQTRLIWTRLAVAASRLPFLFDSLGGMLEPYETIHWSNIDFDVVKFPHGPLALRAQDILGVLSTFAVLGYPTLSDLSVAGCLTGVAVKMLSPHHWIGWDHSTRGVLASQVAFVLALGALGGPLLNNMVLLARRVDSTIGLIGGEHPARNEIIKSFADHQALGMLAVACFPYILNSDPAVETRHELPCPEGLRLQGLLQSGATIPLPDGGLPLSDHDLHAPAEQGSREEAGSSIRPIRAFRLAPSWESWLKGHIAGLIDDIETGDWTAYYSMLRGRGTEVDPPLRGLRFRTSWAEDEPRRLLLEAEGHDEILGAFQLQGWAMSVTGTVELSMSVPGIPSDASPQAWLQDGVVTPMGIVGRWVTTTTTEDPGYMWIYRKEWARIPASDAPKE